MGATWLAISFSVWLFLFVPGATVGWGSRKHRDVVGTLLDQQHEQRQSSNLADQGRILLLSLPAAWLLIVEDFDQAAKSRTHNLEDTKA